MEKELSPRDKGRIKRLYQLEPFLSAKSIAKSLNLQWKKVYAYLVKLGYTHELHLRRLYHRGEYEEIPQEVKVKEKPQPPKIKIHPKKESKTISTNFIDRKPSPETQEKNRQKALYANANKLLEEAIKAGEEGRFDDYMRLRKEYDIASRQAKAYKMRGALSASDKETYWLENKYSAIS